jgi:hypothetical protein
MIIGFILKPLWIFVKWLASLEFDFMTTIPNWYSQFAVVLKIGLSVFPIDVWAIVITNLVFWLGVHLSGSVIRWIYIKIPGVN